MLVGYKPISWKLHGLHDKAEVFPEGEVVHGTGGLGVVYGPLRAVCVQDRWRHHPLEGEVANASTCTAGAWPLLEPRSQWASWGVGAASHCGTWLLLQQHSFRMSCPVGYLFLPSAQILPEAIT